MPGSRFDHVVLVQKARELEVMAWGQFWAGREIPFERQAPVFQRQQDAVDRSQAQAANLFGLGDCLKDTPRAGDLRKIVVKAAVGGQAVERVAGAAELDELLAVRIDKLQCGQALLDVQL